MPFLGCSIFAPAARRGAGLQCSERHDERTTHGRGLGGVEALPAFSCPRFAPFVPMIRPLVSTFWRFRTYERRAGRLHHTAGRIQIQARRPRFRPWSWFVYFLYFGRGAALFALSFARGGRLQSTAAGCLFLHTAKPQQDGRPLCFASLLLFTTFAVERLGI